MLNTEEKNKKVSIEKLIKIWHEIAEAAHSQGEEPDTHLMCRAAVALAQLGDITEAEKVIDTAHKAAKAISHEPEHGFALWDVAATRRKLKQKKRKNIGNTEKEIKQLASVEFALEDIREGKLEAADTVINNLRTVIAKEEALRRISLELNILGHNDYTVALVEKSRNWFGRIHKMRDSDLKDTAIEGLGEILAAAGLANEGLTVVNDYYIRCFNKPPPLLVTVHINRAAASAGDVKTTRVFLKSFPLTLKSLAAEMGNSYELNNHVVLGSLVDAALYLARTGHKKDAIEYLKHINTLGINDPGLFIRLATLYDAIEQVHNAKQTLHEALQLVIDQDQYDDYAEVLADKACSLGHWELAEKAAAVVQDKKERAVIISEVALKRLMSMMT